MLKLNQIFKKYTYVGSELYEKYKLKTNFPNRHGRQFPQGSQPTMT